MIDVVSIADLEQKLKKLKLAGMCQNLKLRLKQAQSDELGYSELIQLLLEDEFVSRSDHRKQKQYRAAHLPYHKDISDFDFSFQPGIKKQQIIELTTCHFLEKKENIILVGQPGVGKTHLATAIGLSALDKGYKVLFTSLWDMVTTLQQSRADYSFPKKVEYYTDVDLLIIDELGYRSLAEKTVEDVFTIVTQRYEKGSLIITSNKPINSWDNIFLDKTLTNAIVDRLLHHSCYIEITGESYRMKQSHT